MLDYWHVYTDGSVMHFPRMGGWAFVRISPDGIRIERSGTVHSYRKGSERMEVMAIVAALVSIPIPGRYIVVHTDCQGAISRVGRIRRCDKRSHILKSWLDRKLWQLLDRHRILFVWDVKPLHSEIKVAHCLAREAARGFVTRR